MQIDTPGVPHPNLYTPQKPPERAGQAEPAVAKSEADDTKPSVIDEIREKGFQAYAEEIRVRKMEELREKILESMGLSEEELAEMPAEQRGQIEDMIAETIRRRMMAQAVINNGDAAPGILDATNPAAVGSIQNGINTGLALLQAIEQLSEEASTSRDRESSDENG